MSKSHASHIITYGDLLKRLLDSKEFTKTVKEDVITSFKEANPTIKKFDDIDQDTGGLQICLGDMCHDEIVQRSLDITNFIDIVSNFEADLVNAPTMYKYEDGKKTSYHIPIDGQHRIVALYFIATEILKEDPADCFITVTMKSFNDPIRASDVFMAMNATNSKALTETELFIRYAAAQKEWGKGGSEYEKAKKQTDLLAKYGYEVVAEDSLADSYCTKNKIYRVVELNKYPVSYTEQYMEYRKSLGKRHENANPISSKELDFMYKYIRQCDIEDIKLSQAYLKDFSSLLKGQFGADFSLKGKGTSQSPLWDEVEKAADNWIKKVQKTDKSFVCPFGKTSDAIGLVYITQQLAQCSRFTRPVPKFNRGGAGQFKLQSADCWK